MLTDESFFRPYGTFFIFACYPTANAVGCNLSPLRGCVFLVRNLSHSEQSSFARRTADGGCPHINFYIKNYR
jgi:hypothetical protein